MVEVGVLADPDMAFGDQVSAIVTEGQPFRELFITGRDDSRAPLSGHEVGELQLTGD